MKIGEVRELEEVELEARLHDYRQELFNLRFQFATRQLTNHARIAQVRRDVARILTVMRERELTPEGENGD